MRRAAVLVFFIGYLLASYSGARAEAEKVLYEGDSRYHHIRVSEADGYRYLSFNRARGSQSVVNVSDHFELKFPYTQAAFVVPAFLAKNPDRILIIGLGGGSVPRVMAQCYPDAQIDVIEIDPQVVEVARRFFFFEPTQMMKIRSMDGRRFLRSSQTRYDLIFLDAYDDRSIPFHLTTREFFEIVRRRLTPGGVLASNVWGPRTDRFYLAELKTYQQVFPHVYLIDCISSFSYIFIAQTDGGPMTKSMLAARIPSVQKRFRFGFELLPYAATFEDVSDARIDARELLDDFAPVENLRTRKALF